MPTKQNPGDLLTRLHVSALIEEDRRWKGPAFLVQEETERPEKKIIAKEEPDTEVRKQYNEDVLEQSFLSTMREDHLDPNRYSS